jgi:pimeloyl-ACP methyl ester carboxylesterase
MGREVPAAQAKGHVNQVARVSAPRVVWQLIRHHTPERVVGDAPVLVIGSPDDKVVPRRSLERVARRYGGAPLLFPGMGHDLMLDARWLEPLDAVLDWLEKSVPPRP